MSDTDQDRMPFTLAVTGKPWYHLHAVPVQNFFISASDEHWFWCVFNHSRHISLPISFQWNEEERKHFGKFEVQQGFFVLYHWPLSLLFVWFVGFSYLLIFFFLKQANSTLSDCSVFWFPDHFPTSRTRLHFLFSLQYQKRIECEGIFKL